MRGTHYALASAMVATALAGCGGGGGGGGSDGTNDSELTALEDRLVTGRDIVTTEDWSCAFADANGEVAFTDEYTFEVDRSGRNREGFFDWQAIEADTVLVTWTTPTQTPTTPTYRIGGIVFTSGDFVDSGFTAGLDGDYFGNGMAESYALDCTRAAPAAF